MSMKATKFSNRNAIFWYFSVPLITRLVIFSVALVWSKYGFYFYNRTLITRLLEKQADYQPRLQELLRGVRGHAPREKSWKIGLSETPYPAFPGSNANNLYVYFVELFSKSRYSWFPSRSAKIHDSQVFKTKNHDFYMFCKYDLSSSPPLSEVGLSLHKVFSTLILSGWKYGK